MREAAAAGSSHCRHQINVCTETEPYVEQQFSSLNYLHCSYLCFEVSLAQRQISSWLGKMSGTQLPLFTRTECTDRVLTWDVFTLKLWPFNDASLDPPQYNPSCHNGALDSNLTKRRPSKA